MKNQFQAGAHTPGRLVVRGRYQLNAAEGGELRGQSATPGDARRLAACWNAFDGVDTDKIEGKTVGEYVASEAYLTGLVPSAGGTNIGLSGMACQMLADLAEAALINSSLLAALRASQKAIQELRNQGAPTAPWNDIEAANIAAIEKATMGMK